MHGEAVLGIRQCHTEQLCPAGSLPSSQASFWLEMSLLYSAQSKLSGFLRLSIAGLSEQLPSWHLK